MSTRGGANNGHPWQSEGDRSSFYAPKPLIPILKRIAYNLDAEGITVDSELKISISESRIIIEIIKD